MDFAKTFDKVPHKRLLYKMKYVGISEQIINWVKSFLSNRTQTVLLENMTSSKIPVTSGVPRGTIIHTLNKKKSCFYLNKCKNKN